MLAALQGAFETARVGRLLAHARAEDPAALRRALETVIERTDFALPGLAPRAVLIVRRLESELPRRRAADGTQAIWQENVRARLVALAAAARRPADDAGAWDAGAAVFRDAAELIACLARDLALGTAGQRWYWRIPLAALPWAGPGDAIAALFEASLVELPGALHALVAMKMADHVLPAITADHAQRLAVRLAEVHGLADLARAIQALPAPGPPPTPAPLPTSRPGLQAPARLLLHLAVRLHHRPGSLREPEALGALTRWWRGVASDGGASQLAMSGPSKRVPHRPDLPRSPYELRMFDCRSSTALPLPALADGEQKAASSQSGMVAEERSAMHARSERRALRSGEPALLRSDERLSGPDLDEPSGRRPSNRTAPDDGGPGPATEGRDEREGVALAAESAASPLDLAYGVETELAGVFYLVNVVLAPEMERHLGTVRRIGPFALIELLARALLPAGERRPHDPVWAVLALLDGRALGQPPNHRRADVRRRLARALPPIRVRLAEALGLEASDRGALARELLVCRGTIHVAGPHIDVVMPLAEGRLAVRLAGLDRDPGWCPAFGRVITFQFR